MRCVQISQANLPRRLVANRLHKTPLVRNLTDHEKTFSSILWILGLTASGQRDYKQNKSHCENWIALRIHLLQSQFVFTVI